MRLKTTLCHGHEGTNYVTRPWASDKGNTRQFTNYVTHPWASDEDDIRTIKRAIPTLTPGRVSTIRRTTTDLD